MPRAECRLKPQNNTASAVHPETLAPVLCQPAKLNRVFLSILENAADAIEHEGEIRIRVTDKDDAVTVEFVDNGKGIAAASLPTLFDFGLSPKRGRVGMRLGLPMSRFSVEEMGGTIAIASVEGEGTAVTIELPAMKP